ncbi:hypothetical protein BMS3Bbin04_00248 [bacterium BMS3Bbin04]|nr:hypothetical protein BMS3Bbin04_00248 [bacterium BMS3Bbin04]
MTERVPAAQEVSDEANPPSDTADSPAGLGQQFRRTPFMDVVQP